MIFKDITLSDASTEAKVEVLGAVLDTKFTELQDSVNSIEKQIGPQGEKGDRGDKGEQGVLGVAGKDGINGRDGVNGRDGKDGLNGLDGIDGPRIVNAEVAIDDTLLLMLSDGSEIKTTKTIVGAKGAGGMNGAQGPMGLQGSQGEQGIQGDTGPAGATGPQGEQGIQGIQGVAGPTGPQGIQGVKGDTGDTGATGAPGTSVNIKGEVATVGSLPSVGNAVGDAYIVTADGNLYTWTGSSWLDVGQIVGPQGATGATGPQGIQGVKGDTGDTGPQGIQGIQGVKGDTGDTGATGATGTVGTQGLKGDTGDTGPQGIQGVKGDTGDTGPAGTAGTNGTNGTNGVGVPVGGTTGQVLAKINATDYNTQWITPAAGGGGSLTSSQASLSADVQMPTSNTWYDGPSLSLAAGTWLINTHTTLARTATTALTYFNRVTTGTVHYASSSQYQASVANHTVSIGLSAVITLASTTTIKIQSTSNAGATSVLMKAALLANGSGNNATQITAVKIA